MMARHVQIIKRKRRKQKWYATFIADNGLILAHTEHYANLTDLGRMLREYFPEWPVMAYDK